VICIKNHNNVKWLILLLCFILVFNIPTAQSLSVEDSVLIDEISDYHLLGVPFNKIPYKYIYTPEVLCEGHLVFAIQLDTNINLNSNQIKNFVKHSKIGSKEGSLSYFVLINESYQRGEKIYEDYWEYEDEIWIKSWQGAFNLVDDYRYVWKNINDLSGFSADAYDYIFIDIRGTFDADIDPWSVDIIPKLEIGVFKQSFDQWAWWDSNWHHRAKITVGSAFVSNDTSGFPLTVYLSDAIGDKADGGDSVRFTNIAGGTEFNYEKDYWVDGQSRICHVNITEVITSGSSYEFYVYYNNSGASAPVYNPAEVWDRNYSAIYHFNNASGNIVDSTWQRNGTGITGDPTYQQPGRVGYALEFDGTTDGAKIPEDFGFSALQQWSIEHWYYANAWEGASGKDNLFTAKGEVKMTTQWNDADDQIDCQWNAGTIYYVESLKGADAPPPTSTWHYLDVTFDKSVEGVAFHNGTWASDNTSGTIQAQSYQNYIGCGSDNADNPNNEFNGRLDEVRVSDTVRNATWLELSYHSQNNSNNFITFGAEETQIEPPTNFKAHTWSSSQINLSWTKGLNTTHTHIQRKTGGYPSDINDGTTVYNDTGLNHADSGLPTPGLRYYYRAWGWNSSSNAYSSSYAEIVNLTKPEAPSGFTVTRNNGTQIDLGWSMGAGATRTHIQYKKNSYPTDINDGTTAYNNTGTTHTHTGLSGGETYYYRGWSYDTNGGFHQYSDGYIEGYLFLLQDAPYNVAFQ